MEFPHRFHLHSVTAFLELGFYLVPIYWEYFFTFSQKNKKQHRYTGLLRVKGSGGAP